MVGLVAGSKSADTPRAPEGLGVAEGSTKEEEEREASPRHGAALAPR